MTTRERLEKELDVAKWDMLHDSFVRNSLFLIHESLDILDVGEKMIANDGAVIKNWIDQSQLYRPDGYDVERWRNEKRFFECLVVFPHVLARPVPFENEKGAQADV